MNRPYKIQKVMEWFFYVGSFIMTTVSSIVFYLCYFGSDAPNKFFVLSNHVYWITVAMYSILRQFSQNKYPTKTTTRRGELFVVYWGAVTIIFTIVTIFFCPEEKELFEELISNLAFLAGIFSGNEGLKMLLNAYLGKTQPGNKPTKKPC